MKSCVVFEGEVRSTAGESTLVGQHDTDNERVNESTEEIFSNPSLGMEKHCY